MIGIPGVADVFERFCNAYRQARGGSIALAYLGADGRRMGASVARTAGRSASNARAGGCSCSISSARIRLVIERLGQIEAVGGLMLGATCSRAVDDHAHAIDGMQTPPNGGSQRSYGCAPYRHALGARALVDGNADAFAEVLHVSHCAADAGRMAVRGDRRCDRARHRCDVRRRIGDSRTSVPGGDAKLRSPRLPMMYRTRASISLMRCSGKAANRMRGRRSSLRMTRSISERAVGLFLLESRQVVNELLDFAPPKRAPTRVACATARRIGGAGTNRCVADEHPHGGALAALVGTRDRSARRSRGGREQQAHRARAVAQPAHGEAPYREHPRQARLRFPRSGGGSVSKSECLNDGRPFH